MNKILLEIKHYDKSVLKLMKTGLQYSFSLLVFSCVILFTYNFIYPSPVSYEIGISLFKSASYFIASFIVFGISFNKIKQDLKIEK